MSDFMKRRGTEGVLVLAGIIGTIAAQHAVAPAQAAPRAASITFEEKGGIDLAVQLSADRRTARAGIYVTSAGAVEVNGKPSTDAHALKVGDALKACAQVVMTEVPQMGDSLTAKPEK